ncbi:MAG TPA: MFS transporter [Micromonosporaceae bacterium]|nr:MFS transporter [Micromonosporaceae bacterium]
MLRRTFQSLQVRNYRLYASGQLVKLVGMWMQFITQDWLVLHLSGDSGTALGIVTALQFTPMLLLTLYGGKLADRHDKRQLLMVANGIWAVLAMALAVLVATGAVQLWHVFVFAAALGLATAVEAPARQAFVSELVGTTLLPNALSLSAATFNSARIIGPALAGVGIAAFGTGPVFLVSALCALSPLVGLARMRPAELHRADLPPRGERADARIRDGLRYVWRRGDLVLPLAMVMVIGAMGFNFGITLAVLAKTTFHTGAASFGLFTTALAAGSLVGALASSGRRARPSVYVVLGAALVFSLLEIVVGLMPTFWLVAALLVPTGFSMIYFAQAANQRVQLGSEGAYRGRVMALYMLVFLGTTPLGAPLTGWLAEAVSAQASIWIGGVISLVTALAGLVVQLRSSGDRIRVRARPSPRFYVAAADARTCRTGVVGCAHGEHKVSGVPRRRLRAAARGGGGLPRPGRAELSRVDSGRPRAARGRGLPAQDGGYAPR